MAPRPRGRPRKRPLARVGAAIDAMKPFGFSRYIVVKTIKELQNVYGEEGWPFIEEGSYKVLLEAILDKVNGGEASDSKKQDGETSMALKPTCSNSEAYPPKTALQTSTAMEMDPASETNEGFGTTKLTTESKGKHLSLAEAGGSESDRRHVQPPLSTNQPGEHQRSRRPYYGWICSGDEEEPDLVVLKPGDLGQEIDNWLASLRRQNTRKQRWDVKPDGI